jgi:hypothetical protein
MKVTQKLINFFLLISDLISLIERHVLQYQQIVITLCSNH